jgi:hypothetical protein
MVGFALGLVKGWKLWAGLALIALVSTIVISYNNAIKTAVSEKERADAWQKATASWQAAYRRSEGLREQESRQAVSSFERERQQCNQRVADSLQSAQRIRSVVRVERVEVPGTCEAGSVITTDELRNALGTD